MSPILSTAGNEEQMGAAAAAVCVPIGPASDANDDDDGGCFAWRPWTVAE